MLWKQGHAPTPISDPGMFASECPPRLRMGSSPPQLYNKDKREQNGYRGKAPCPWTHSGDRAFPQRSLLLLLECKLTCCGNMKLQVIPREKAPPGPPTDCLNFPILFLGCHECLTSWGHLYQLLFLLLWKSFTHRNTLLCLGLCEELQLVAIKGPPRQFLLDVSSRNLMRFCYLSISCYLFFYFGLLHKLKDTFIQN